MLRGNLLIASALAASCGLAQAAIVTVSGYDASGNNQAKTTPFAAKIAADQYQAEVDGFFGTTVSFGSDTLEGLATGTTKADLKLGNGVTASLNGDNGSVAAVPSGQATDDGRFSIGAGTSKYWKITAGSTFDITFDKLVSTFSFYATDLGDFETGLTLQLLDASGIQVGSLLPVTTARQDCPPGPTGSSGCASSSVLFFGLYAETTADRFKSIRFTSATASTFPDYYGFDNFSVGAVPDIPTTPRDLPEPLSLALVGTALAALPLTRRRRA